MIVSSIGRALNAKSKYYRASKAGGKHSYVREITAGREKRRENEKRAVGESPAEAGGCARMRLSLTVLLLRSLLIS
jgi:hypothetical protein